MYNPNYCITVFLLLGERELSDKTIKKFKNLYVMLVAILVVGQVILGWYMTGLSYSHRLYHSAPSLHKAIGLIVMVLVFFRICVILKKGVPKASQFLRSIRHEAYGANFLLIYFLVLLCCLTGYSFVTSRGKPVSFFGFFDVPALISWGKAAEPFLSRAHDILVYATALVIVRHGFERGIRALGRKRNRS